MTPSYIQRLINFNLCIVGFFVCLKLVPQNLVTNTPIFNPFAPNLGEVQSLYPEILAMKSLALRLQINDFDLSPNLNLDPYIYMRSIEFLYPIRKVSGSKYIFSLGKYPNGKICEKLGAEGSINLYACDR